MCTMLEALSDEFRNRISDPSGAIVSGRFGKSVNEKEWRIAKPYKALISVWSSHCCYFNLINRPCWHEHECHGERILIAYGRIVLVN